MNNHLLYTPSGLNFIDWKTKFWGRPAAYWLEGAYYRHDAALISFALAGDDDFRRNYKIPDDFLLVGDSGGFQNLSIDSRLAPLNVLGWQERNCDIGFILDWPPYKKTGPSTVDFVPEGPTGFKTCKERTAYNARVMCANRKKPGFKLYGIVQGVDVSQLKEWHEAVSVDTEFDGWAVAPKPSSDPMRVAIQGLYVAQFGLPVHFFQCISFDVLPVLVYLAYKAKKMYTFDNSAWGLEPRKFFRYSFWKNCNQNRTFSTQQPVTIDRLPCPCPICQTFNERMPPKELNEYLMTSTKRIDLFAFHRLWWYLREIEAWNILVNDRLLFEEYIKTFGVNKEGTFKAIEIIDEAYERGIPETLDKYDRPQHSLDDMLG